MRFKKGTKVEVLSQKEVPSGCWRCAEIISGNGRNYTVQYDGEKGGFGGGVVEKVARKAIRPCPPSVDVVGNWVPGDVVEVLRNGLWMMATVLEVLGRDHLLVRMLGSAIELQVNKYDVRARLCWQDGEWFVIGKASNKSEDTRFRLPSSCKVNNLSQKVVSRSIKGDHFPAGNKSTVLESQWAPSKNRKRKAYHEELQIEAYTGHNQRIRAGGRESKRRQVNIMQQPQLPEKVDDVACSGDFLGKKCMSMSILKKSNGYSQMILEREKADGADGYACSISIESNNDEPSVASSVGSCSPYRSHSHKLHNVLAAGPLEGNDSQCSDAESFCQLRVEEQTCVPSSKQDLTEEVHRLELRAYRSIIEALHASGPLSWDQELLLTNLRDSLHISNDEHLMEGYSRGLLQHASESLEMILGSPPVSWCDCQYLRQIHFLRSLQ